MRTAKKIALLGILTGLALISYILESMLPSIYLPGAKIGISNVFSLLTAIVFGLPEALILTIVRTTLGSLVTGSLSALVYSLPAGIIAVTVSYLLYRATGDKISVTAASTAGATVHNLVQNAVFCLITHSVESFVLLPYLGVFGAVSGIIVGLVVLLILKTVPTSVWNTARDKGGKIENT